MGNQRETLVPSEPKYILLFSRQTNNTDLKAIIASNASIHNNILDYLWVDMAHLFAVNE